MGIQTEIDRIITAVRSAHEKVAEKGGTTSEPYLIADLERAIDSIPENNLPVLTFPASDAEVFEGKEYIKQDGSAGAGAFTLEDEIREQDDLIAQIKTALANKTVEVLDPELEEQAALINELLTTLESKAAASASPDTCTVTITTSRVTYIASAILYSVVEDGKIAVKFVDASSLGNSVTITDCLCNSTIWIHVPNSIVSVSQSSNMTRLRYNDSLPSQSTALVYVTPADAGATGTIRIESD